MHKKEDSLMNKKVIPLIATGLIIVLILLSFFVVAEKYSNPDSHRHAIETLDEKNKTVKELAAASAAASAAITLIPGDAGTPLAEKLADLSTYFLVIISALYLEKYLLTLTGFVAFKIIIPIALIFLLLYLYRGTPALRRLALRLAIFGASIFLVIPASVKVSDMIESTYQASIEETIESAKNASSEIQEESEKSQKSEDSKSGLSALVNKFKTGVSDGVDNLENILNRFIEALAVMIVTSCVIPILVLLCFVWLTKTLLSVDIPTPQLEAINRKLDRLTMK